MKRTLLGLVVASTLLPLVGCSSADEVGPARRAPSSAESTAVALPDASATTRTPPRTIRDLRRDLHDELATDRGLVVSLMAYVGDPTGEASAAIGVATRAPRRAVRPDDTVMVLSFTKAVVATAVMSLVEDGRLRLQDTVDHWLPGIIRRGDEITVEQLLSMTSGLASYDTSSRYPGGGQLPARQLVALNQALAEPMLTEPGEKGRESNTNPVLLGLIIEAVTGRPFAEVVRQRVLVPAGMTHTAFGGAPDVHGFDGRSDVTVIDPPYPSAAAGLVSTVADMGHFLSALVDRRLVSARTLADMTHDRTVIDGERWGLGLRLRTSACGETIGQVGGGSGESASAWIVPTAGRVVAVSSDLYAAGLGQQLVDDLLCD